MKYTLFKGKSRIFLFLFICFSYSCSNNEEIVVLNSNEIAEFQNISYGENSQQIFDIYLPKNRSVKQTKVFIIVHGGSWISGDKSDLDELKQSLKNQFTNYAIVNINYRLASIGNSPFPMQINDIENVISTLKSKASEYQISNKYGLIGVSAGAHLSLLYSYKYDFEKNVKMVCSVVGPTNFTDENYLNNPDFTDVSQGIALITGVNFTDNPTYYEELSPYHIVTNLAPPTILFYGGMDDLIPTSQGVDMHSKLNEIGVVNEFYLYENEGHGWDGIPLQDTHTKLENFISKYF